MGAIAAHGGPEARKMFIEVLVASASVPIAFPPSLIQVRGGDKTFRELHVDGQTESAFVAVPQTLLYGRTPAQPTFPVRLYVIVNGSLSSSFTLTPRATLPIVARTMDVASKASLREVVITTAQFCKANGCELFVADLPPGIEDSGLDFSRAHIESLFNAGKAEIDAGVAWRTAPRKPADAGAR
jgi:predicted acylesterase/phospholipase RssA